MPGTTVAGMLVAALVTSPTTAQMEKVPQSRQMPVVGAHRVGIKDEESGLPLVG